MFPFTCIVIFPDLLSWMNSTNDGGFKSLNNTYSAACLQLSLGNPSSREGKFCSVLSAFHSPGHSSACDWLDLNQSSCLQHWPQDTGAQGSLLVLVVENIYFVLCREAAKKCAFCLLVKGPVGIKLLRNVSIAIKRGVTFTLTFSTLVTLEHCFPWV